MIPQIRIYQQFILNLDLDLNAAVRICDLSKADVDDECNGCVGDQRINRKVFLHSSWW